MTAWVHLRAVAFRQTTTAAMTAAPLATQRAAAPTTRWAELVAATPRSSGAPPRPATTPPKRLLVVAGGPCPPRPTRRQPRVSDSRARLLCPLGPRRRPRGNAHRLWPGRPGILALGLGYGRGAPPRSGCAERARGARLLENFRAFQAAEQHIFQLGSSRVLCAPRSRSAAHLAIFFALRAAAPRQPLRGFRPHSQTRATSCYCSHDLDYTSTSGARSLLSRPLSASPESDAVHGHSHKASAPRITSSGGRSCSR